ncbi:tetratricopeptide repeat protein [Streptomyces sp. IBSBF 2806]|uniref:tetratricopeptide repeat protein n=1 Tax=Streptomyces sp. IBSBF 2806 TaxID=2903529 RepID=UPI002FDBB195
MLDHISGDLEGVLIEHSTDVIVLPISGMPELVSIKHREANRSGDASWSWSALRKDSVLKDLYDAWCASGRSCTVAFWSNNGFSGTAHEIWRVCTGKITPTATLIAKLSSAIGASASESQIFLRHLHLPELPLPRRNEISDVGIRRMAKYLESKGRSARFAEYSYTALIRAIGEAGTQLPESRSGIAKPLSATIRDDLKNRPTIEGYLSASALRNIILFEADRQAASGLNRTPSRSFREDSLFTGRSRELAQIRELLRPGDADVVAPVVIHGLAGIGKTSLASQFAACEQETLRPIFVDGSNKASLLESLAVVSGVPASVPMSGEFGISKTEIPPIVESSATLLIIDGVTDAKIIRGVIPRKSLTRIIITSTAPYVDEGFQYVALEAWTQEESKSFVAKALPMKLADSIDELLEYLAGHPLALNQAVNYCNSSHISLSEYISRLKSQSLELLSRGEASKHPISAAKAILLALDAIDATDRHAGSLIRILSFVGAEPIPISLFTGEPMRPWVTNGREKLRLKKFPWQKDRLPNWGGCADDETGWNSRIALWDDLQRDESVTALCNYGLGRVDGGHLVVHPLVQLIVREATKDKVPWIESAIGLLAAMMPMEHHNAEVVPMYRYTGHIRSAVRFALAENLTGPAVVFSAVSVCDELLNLGDVEGAVTLATEIRRVCKKLIHLGFVTPPAFFKISQTLANALAYKGVREEALNVAMENISIVLHHYPNDLTSKMRAYADLGRIACRLHDASLAEMALNRLPDPTSEDPQTAEVQTWTRLMTAHIKFRILLLLNKEEEASQINLWSLEKISEWDISGDPNSISAAIYGDAAALALHRNDAPDRILHQKAVVEQLANSLGHSVIYAENVLELADSYLDEGNVPEAIPLLEEAELFLSTIPAGSNLLKSKYLSCRGRMRLLSCQLGDNGLYQARQDMVHALELMEGMPNAAPLPATLLHLARTYSLMGDEKQALEIANRALQLDLARYGPDHSETRIDKQVISIIPYEAMVARRFMRMNRKA